MKKIPKTAKGKAGRVRDKYMKKSGISSLGVVGSGRAKTQVAEWSWQMKSNKSLLDQIKADVKLMGGAVFKGPSVGGGEVVYYANFVSHK